VFACLRQSKSISLKGWQPRVSNRDRKHMLYDMVFKLLIVDRDKLKIMDVPFPDLESLESMNDARHMHV
jgi:hypothetical protein